MSRTDEERLLERVVQSGLLAGDQPVATERRLKRVAVEVGAEHEDTGLSAPVPFVLPVSRALLVGRAALARLRHFRHLTSGCEDRVALGLGDLGDLLLGHTAAAEEERQACRPAGLEDILPCETAVLRRV